ncbi:MAG TPA: hypothetical protein VMZ04_02450 [Anaerolineae bacterium]|nr:hypothetical protein [Anaerolineae bacterium]
MKIGPRTIEGMARQCENILTEHDTRLSRAFLMHGDEVFKIGITFDLTVSSNGIVSKPFIAYLPEPRVKEPGASGTFNDLQTDLFEEEPEPEIVLHPDLRCRAHVQWMLNWENTTRLAFTDYLALVISNKVFG